MKKFCGDLKKHATEIINYEQIRCYHLLSMTLNQTTIKHSATSSKRSFMMLMIPKTIAMIAMMIAVMIAMVRNYISEGFMMTPQDVLVLMMTSMIVMMIMIQRN